MLEQFQAEAANRTASVERQLSEAQAQANLAKKQMSDAREIESKLNAATASARQWREQLTNAQKYVLKLENENATLRKGFEQTMQRLKVCTSAFAIPVPLRCILITVFC